MKSKCNICGKLTDIKPLELVTGDTLAPICDDCIGDAPREDES